MKLILYYPVISLLLVIGLLGFILKWIIKPFKALSHLMMLEFHTAKNEITTGWIYWDIDVRDEFK